MKRIVAVLLILCMLLSGCIVEGSGGSSVPEPSTSSEPSEASEPETSEPPEEPTLMESAVPIGQLGNLSYIPNAEIESMTAGQMQIFDDALLLWADVYVNDGCYTEFKLISLENGALLGDWELANSGFVTVQTAADKLGICDACDGTVYILDNTLTEIDRYTMEASEDSWYLSSDLKTLYQVNWQTGVTARDLATGVTDEVLADATYVTVCNQTESHLVLSYTDLISQRYLCRSLNLQNGLLERLPVDAGVNTAVFTDSVYLIGDSHAWGTYYVIVDGERKTAQWQENRFDLLLPQCHLLAMDADGLGMSVYEADGTFISRCEVPEEQAFYIGQDIVWSDEWNGYFLFGAQEYHSGKLLFWDIAAPTSGEDFPLQKEQEQGGTSAKPALYARAKELGERFDVNILIADQCRLKYDLFSAYEINDTEYVTMALDVMENALSKYPDGYMEQLKYGSIQSINFELVGGLHPDDESVYSGSYAGIATEEADCYTVVLDVYTICENNIYHELTHVTDKRLAWDALLREDALFSEEGWNELLPEGFTYAQTYQELPDSIWDYVYSGYFVNDYACRYATEDRATMVEMAMLGSDFVYESNPYLRDKLAYYSECIRDCFNTDGWPEVTAWEEMLYR